MQKKVREDTASFEAVAARWDREKRESSSTVNINICMWFRRGLTVKTPLE
jgi:hypothetical protein